MTFSMAEAVGIAAQSLKQIQTLFLTGKLYYVGQVFKVSVQTLGKSAATINS